MMHHSLGSGRWRNVALWIRRGGLSLVDQAVVSLTTFLASVLLARWMGPKAFGAYAVAFSALLLVSGLQNGMILEPMSVFGPSLYRSMLGGYVALNLRANSAICIGLTGILSLSCLAAGDTRTVLGQSFLGLAVSVPLILTYWFLRRACYLRLRPGLAAAGGGMYAGAVLGLLAVFHLREWISPLTAFVTLGAGSAMACLLLAAVLLRRERPGRGDAPPRREALQHHWKYGKWILSAGLLSWLVNSVTVPLSAAILGLEMAGAFKALENLVMPLDRSFTAFGLLALPALSTRRARVGDSETLKTSGRLSFVAVGVALCYSALLIFAAPRIVELVYGDPFYVQYSWILVFFGVSAVLGAAGFGIAAGIRVIEKPRIVFVSLMIGVVPVVLAGVWLTTAMGLAGAALTQLAGTALNTASLVFYWTRLVRKRAR